MEKKKLTDQELIQLKLLAAVYEKEQESVNFATYRAQIARSDLETLIKHLAVKYEVSAADVNWKTGELIEGSDLDRAAAKDPQANG